MSVGKTPAVDLTTANLVIVCACGNCTLTM